MLRLVTARPLKIYVYEHLTSGGMCALDLEPAWLEEGRRMHDTAVALFEAAGCEVVTTVDYRLKHYYPNAALIINPDEGFGRIITKLLEHTDYGLCIAPETDQTLENVTIEAGYKLGWNLGCTLNAVMNCGDKREFSWLMNSHGIPHPETWMADDKSAPWRNSTGPFFVKPRDGAGSLSSFRVGSAAVIEELTASDPQRFIIQKAIPGKSMSLSVLADGLGKIIPVGVCEHQLKIMTTGPKQETFLTADGVYLPDFDPLVCLNSLKALSKIDGLRGWVGVDFIWDEAGEFDTVIEINPRLTMSCCWISEAVPLQGMMRQWLEIVQ